MILVHVIYISYRDDSQAKVWSSSRLVAQGIEQAPKEVLQDGLHISKKALEQSKGQRMSVLMVHIRLRIKMGDELN
jgi:predicted secreted acid phosphatase